MSSPLFSDTSPDAERFLVEGYRRMSPGAKLERVRELIHGVQQMALARLRVEHPMADEGELRLHLAALWLDPEIMREAFHWDTDERGADRKSGQMAKTGSSIRSFQEPGLRATGYGYLAFQAPNGRQRGAARSL